MSADHPSHLKEESNLQTGAPSSRTLAGGSSLNVVDGLAFDAETPTSRWRFALLVVLAWTVPGLMTTTVGLTMNRPSGANEPEVSLVPIFVSQLAVWWCWAAATPVVWWLGRKVPLEKHRLVRAIALHAAFAIAAGVLYSVSSALIIRWCFPSTAGAEPLIQWIQNYLASRLPVGVLLYFALLGIGAAFDSRKRLRLRDLQASQLSAQLARAQVQALQTQLQPHFLFNTLHAIGMLVHEDPASAGRMLTRLGDLLRQTLALTDVPEITLREELSILDDYLGIERVRFGDRLTVDLEIEPDLLNAAVPTFVLQPLVENAVRFGVTSRVGPGRIRIAAKRVGSSMQLVVQDDGPEAPEQQSKLATLMPTSQVPKPAHWLTRQQLVPESRATVSDWAAPRHDWPPCIQMPDKPRSRSSNCPMVAPARCCHCRGVNCMRRTRDDRCPP
jgi:two-component system, LytTR family, sensor kinase